MRAWLKPLPSWQSHSTVERHLDIRVHVYIDGMVGLILFYYSKTANSLTVVQKKCFIVLYLTWSAEDSSVILLTQTFEGSRFILTSSIVMAGIFCALIKVWFTVYSCITAGAFTLGIWAWRYGTSSTIHAGPRNTSCVNKQETIITRHPCNDSFRKWFSCILHNLAQLSLIGQLYVSLWPLQIIF